MSGKLALQERALKEGLTCYRSSGGALLSHMRIGDCNSAHMGYTVRCRCLPIPSSL